MHLISMAYWEPLEFRLPPPDPGGRQPVGAGWIDNQPWMTPPIRIVPWRDAPSRFPA